MFQIFINIFRPIKIKIKCFAISFCTHTFFHYYNELIKLLETFIVISLHWYKRYIVCLILLFTFLELFRAFICVDNIGTLVNKVFNLVISPFQRFIFILSAMVSSGSNFTSSWPSIAAIDGIHLHLNINKYLSLEVYFELLSFFSELLQVNHAQFYIYLEDYYII